MTALKKDKVHTRYFAHDDVTGKKYRVPGVTTITGVLDKPALKYWANRIGLEGIDIRSYVDTRAEMGSCAHDMVEAYLLGEKPYLDEYSKVVIDAAENSLISFYKAMESVEWELIDTEIPLVSEKHKYGGTCDIYWVYNGKKRLTDLKTGKDIYPDQWTQVAAYRALLAENGFEVEETSILNIPRGEDEKFKHELIDDSIARLHFKRFLRCREIYELNKQLGVNSWRS